MSLQYISDNSGQHTAVIIPIDEWNEITAKHEDLKELMLAEEKPVYTKRKPSDFVGILSKEKAKEMINDIEKSRDDWERDF